MNTSFGYGAFGRWGSWSLWTGDDGHVLLFWLVKWCRSLNKHESVNFAREDSTWYLGMYGLDGYDWNWAKMVRSPVQPVTPWGEVINQAEHQVPREGQWKAIWICKTILLISSENQIVVLIYCAQIPLAFPQWYQPPSNAIDAIIRIYTIQNKKVTMLRIHFDMPLQDLPRLHDPPFLQNIHHLLLPNTVGLPPHSALPVSRDPPSAPTRCHATLVCEHLIAVFAEFEE